MREEIPLHDLEKGDSPTGKSECLALVWDEDDEDTKPPAYESLIFTGQTDALTSYFIFSNSHSHHGKLLSTLILKAESIYI